MSKAENQLKFKKFKQYCAPAQHVRIG